MKPISTRLLIILTGALTHLQHHLHTTLLLVDAGEEGHDCGEVQACKDFGGGSGCVQGASKSVI